MQGLIAIGFGQANVVFEPSGNRAKHVMDDRQCAVTLVIGLDNNSDSSDVVDFFVFFMLLLHLLENPVEMLRPTADIDPADAQLIEPRFEPIGDFVELGFTIAASFSYEDFGFIVGIRFQVFKTQVF